MAKLSKEEILAKIDATGLTDDEKISFMEDISDSFSEPDTTEVDGLKAEVEKLNSEIEDLKNKYKARFLSNEEVKEVEEKEEVEPEMEEKEYVDVKDIFTEEKEEEE